MRAYAWAIGVALTAVAAGLVTWTMAPSAQELIDPAPARAADFFTSQQIDRGQAFRGPQRAIGLLSLLVQVGLLVYLVRRVPARLQRAQARWWHGMLAGGAIALALSVVTLPLSIVARSRSLDVGLSTRSWPGWMWDWLLSSAINAVSMGVVAVALLALMRRWPRGWWAPGALVVVVLATAWTVLRPLALDPLFNDFKPLPRGPLRTETLALAREAGVRASEVLVMDASRRTTGANAYVAGLGATKRIVLYDTLLRDFSREEQLNIVAHELGHEYYDDLRGGLLYVAIVAPFGMFAAAALTRRLSPAEPGSPATLPALGLALVLITTGVGWISNDLSRRVEARADAFALRATDAPDALIALQRRIVVRNVADPDPPWLVTAVLATHPPPMDRIGMALGYRVERATARASLLARYP